MPLEEGMLRYRIDVGHNHKVKPGNIVGAIANEAGLDSQYIGHIAIQDDHSLVDLPDGMPREIFKKLKNVWVSGQRMNIRCVSEKERPEKSEKTKPATRAKKNAKPRKKPAAKPKKPRKKKPRPSQTV